MAAGLNFSRKGDGRDEHAPDMASNPPHRLARCLRRVHLGGMIVKLKSGEYRLYSRKKDPRTGKRRNLGTFKTLAEAKRHERAVQFFKRQR
jgi:hypothetical protein